MQPIRRDIQFDIPAEHIMDWHGDGVGVTQFINALSVFFPAGERFFIDSVRNYLSHIDDPQLQAAVRGFIGQEAMHGREHDRWNNAYFQAVPKVKKIERFATRRLKRWQKWLPKSTQLAMTIGAEHITAVLGDFILRHPEFIEGKGAVKSRAEYVAVLQWHALEETEHKAVAYDVWKTVMRRSPKAYVERCLGLLFMIVAYAPLLNQVISEGLKAQAGDIDIAQELNSLRQHLYGKDGLIRAIILPVLGYARPGFHPWDDDNRALLEQMHALEAQYGT